MSDTDKSEHTDDLDQITEQIGELLKKASEESGVRFGFGTPLKIDPSWSESETQQQIEAHRKKFLDGMGLRLVEPKKEDQ